MSPPDRCVRNSIPTMNTAVVVTYRGVPYRRYPHAAHHPDRTYYRSSSAHGKQYLHRVVYANVNGPLPPGHRVIHRDGNPENNAPVNLVAVPATPPAPRRTRAQMLASAENNLLVPDGYALSCEHCGEPFVCYRKVPARFCSGRCRTAHWRAEHAHR